MSSLIELFRKIRLVIFDMDGVLTDGKLLIQENNNWVRKMDIKDGYAIQHAIRNGLSIAVITGSFSNAVRERMSYLGVDSFHEKVKDKGEKVLELAGAIGVSTDEIIFVGDDIPDLSAFDKVGVRACPADAVQDVKERSDFISQYQGGNGCVREILEKILRVQGKWQFSTKIASI